MYRYLNPNGRDWGPMNLDGYGQSLIAFIVVYSLFFYAACAYLWSQRKHPVIKMRKIGLAIASLLTLHVYMVVVFLVYPINGGFPCGVEYWVMSLYLPIGFGLFQAQNQQLLIVSKEQHQLILTDDMFKPLGPRRRGPKQWMIRFKLWWNDISAQGKYEGYVAIGIALQVSLRASLRPTLLSPNDIPPVLCILGNLLCITQMERIWCHLPTCVSKPMPERLGMVSCA